MTRYRMHEGELALSTNWKSDSLTSLSVPVHAAQPQRGEKGRRQVHLMVTTTAVAPDDQLATVVDAHTAQLRRSLPRFEALHRRDRVIGGKQGVDFAIRHASENGTHVQRTAAVITGARLVCLVAAGEAELFEIVNDVFERAVTTVRWRDDEESP